MNAAGVSAALRAAADESYARRAASYFKTKQGEYGYGDVFIGVRVPEQRRIAKQFASIPLAECAVLLASDIHEDRLTSLLILEAKFVRADDKARREIFEMLMENRDRINNWDLVDSCAPQIIGAYLLDRSRARLFRLARSESLWERRIAIVATQRFIRAGDFQDTFKIGELLLQDKHDLIHKAVGWMLREVGDRDKGALIDFLNRHAGHMPRTMLRYAIEKFPQTDRLHYMKRTD